MILFVSVQITSADFHLLNIITALFLEPATHRIVQWIIVGLGDGRVGREDENGKGDMT